MLGDLRLEVWDVPPEMDGSEPVRGGRGRTPTSPSRSARRGARPGAPAGSGSPARCRPRGPPGAVSTWASTRHARLPVRGAGLPARRHAGQGLNPRNHWVRVASPRAARSSCHVEAASNPVMLDYQPFQPTPLGDQATAGDEPLYRLARHGSRRLRRRGLGTGPGPRGARRADGGAARGRRRAAGRSCVRVERGPGRARPAGRRRHRRPAPAPRSPTSLGRARARRARTGSAPSATRTSTRPGCGRCARPCARWPAPPPT